MYIRAFLVNPVNSYVICGGLSSVVMCGEALTERDRQMRRKVQIWLEFEILTFKISTIIKSMLELSDKRFFF